MYARLKTLTKRFCAVLLVTCASVSLLPAAAFAEVATLADEPVSGTVEVDENWTLAYTVEDGEATIDYAAVYPEGTADLTIPATVSDSEGGEDVPVTGIGEGAFCGAEANADYHEGGNHLADVVLSDSVRFIEENAFRSTPMTSMLMGTGITYVKSYGVSYNLQLIDLNFATGASPEYFARYAFCGNSALTELSIPPLTGHEFSWNYRLGDYCFTNCSSLEQVTFEAGDPNKGSEYTHGDIIITSYVFENCAIKTMISYLEDLSLTENSNPSHLVAATYDTYFALYFYASQEEEQADTARLNAVNAGSYALIKKATSMIDIAACTVAAEDFYGKNRVPDVSTYDSSADMVWGFGDDAISTTPNNSYSVGERELGKPLAAYPVSRSDMDYAYVVLNGAHETASGSNNQTINYLYYLYSTGVDLSDITAYSPDGKEVDPALHEMVYTASDGTEYTDYTTITSVGSYTACARGTGEYADTQTSSHTFQIVQHEASVASYSSGTATHAAAQASYEAAADLVDPAFVVVAPAENWQASLVATALAGSGNGLAVFSDGTDTDDTMFQAIMRANVDQLSFVGPTSQISEAAIDRAKILVTGDEGAYNYFSEADAEALALDVYDKVAEFGPTADNPHEWGGAAILMSPDSCLYTASISQYAYAAAAPVLYTKADGSISTDTKEALSNFDSIVVAGDEKAVPASTVTALQDTGATVTRICEESQAYGSSAQVADLMTSDCDATASTVCVADATSPSCVMAASQLAALSGGLTYACASSAETKACQQMLYSEVGCDNMDTTYLVGPFVFDSGVVSRMKDIVSGKELQGSEFAFADGDTFEDGGLIFTADSSSAATLSSVADSSLTTINASTASYENVTYTVNALAASALSGNKTITSVTLGNVPSIPANACKGCTALKSASFPAATKMAASSFSDCSALTSISIPKVVSIPASAFKGLKKLSSVSTASATSIGASAFQNCSALKSASFTSAKTIGSFSFANCTALTSVKLPKVTSIPASAFSGDKKLKSASFGTVASIGASAFSGCAALTGAPTAKATSIGTSAFSGCSSLKSVKASSIKTIGASAFKGCKKLAKVNLASKKLKSIGANAFNGDKKLKKITIKSTKLKKVGKRAFKGCAKKMTVKVPKAKVKKYKKLLTKAGISKKAKVTA